MSIAWAQYGRADGGNFPHTNLEFIRSFLGTLQDRTNDRTFARISRDADIEHMANFFQPHHNASVIFILRRSPIDELLATLSLIVLRNLRKFTSCVAAREPRSFEVFRDGSVLVSRSRPLKLS